MAEMARTLPADNRVLFYKRDHETYGFLSNFHPAPIVIDGQTWPTVEHFYQAQKSPQSAYQQAIREAFTPGRAKRLGAPPDAPNKESGQSWFRRNAQVPRSDWSDVKLDVMKRAVQAKFNQNNALAAELLATGNAELVEDAGSDAYWGTGPDGQGLNWLGQVLMEVRAELASAIDKTPTNLLHQRQEPGHGPLA